MNTGTLLIAIVGYKFQIIPAATIGKRNTGFTSKTLQRRAKKAVGKLSFHYNKPDYNNLFALYN